MDQKKIGRYIADKRKELGLTQIQLAEKLNMSNKSVSKWERGVCLPDVSVYSQLCEVLGISLTEFLSGEDISKNELIPKSEEAIINITRDNKRSKNRLNFLVVLLLIIVFGIVSLIAGGFAEDLDEDQDGFFDGGITPIHEGSSEAQIANLLNEGDVYLYRYNVRESYNRMQVLCYWYEEGRLIDKSTLLSYMSSGKHYGEGMIAIIDDYDECRISVKITLEGENYKYGPDDTVCDSFELPLEGASLHEWQETYDRIIYDSFQGKKMRLDASSETGLLVMTYDKEFSSEKAEKFQDTEFWPKVREYCPEIADNDYTVFITVKTWHEAPVETWRTIYKVWP